MSDAYIPLELVAIYEEIPYNTLVKRIERSPDAYKTKQQPRESGKPKTLVAVSSLSTKARKVYRAERGANTMKGGDIVVEELEDQEVPWYVEADYHWFRDKYPKQFEKGEQTAALMREFTDYVGDNRTEFAEQFAADHGYTTRTLYRKAEDYLTASAWALKFERDTGRSHDFFRVLAVCRKPKDADRFPSLDPEIKAQIENVWFDKEFRANKRTKQMLYNKLEEVCEASGVYCPSYVTVSRYITTLQKQSGEGVEFLAGHSTIEWRNRYMFKANRDLQGLDVMEIVVGDVHTFDLWVKYTPLNGRPIAIRPKVIGWMDMRSRRLVGYAMCRDSNTDDIKSSFARVVMDYGAPKHLLIDNGKDFANADTLGHDRKERMLFNSDIAGFYKSMGVEEVFRSLPFQPWDKPIERAFRTVCLQLSKQFASYTGTLTASRTDDKVRKDIKGMLERDELFTMQEFYTLWEKWVTEVYETNVHQGLRSAGEKQVTPRGLFENADNRHFRPAPPESYVAMLLMKAKRAFVNSTGIRHNNETYMCPELVNYIKQHVYIRYLADDCSKIFAFDETGSLICEVSPAERMVASFYVDEEQVERHKRAQNKQLHDQRAMLDAYRTPFADRPENADATPRLIGGVELTLGKPAARKVVSLPNDEKLAEVGRQQERERRMEFYDKRGQEVLDKLKKMG